MVSEFWYLSLSPLTATQAESLSRQRVQGQGRAPREGHWPDVFLQHRKPDVSHQPRHPVCGDVQGEHQPPAQQVGVNSSDCFRHGGPVWHAYCPGHLRFLPTSSTRKGRCCPSKSPPWYPWCSGPLPHERHVRVCDQSRHSLNLLLLSWTAGTSIAHPYMSLDQSSL